MKNRKFLIILAGIAGVFVLICLACGVLALNTASSPTFQATMTAQAIARITPNITSTPTSVPQPTLPPLPTSTPPLPTATPTQTPTPIPVKVSAKQTVNVRQAPSTQAAIVGKLQANTNVVALAKSEDGLWLQIPIPDAANPGWVSTSVVSVTGATESLRIVSVMPTSTATRAVVIAKTVTPIKPSIELSPTELAYALVMAQIGDDYAFVMEGFSKLAGGVSSQPSLLLDNEWRSDMALVLAAMKKISRDIRGLTPPTRFASIHSDMTEMAIHLDAFVNFMATGLDELNPDKLKKAGQELDMANAALNRATAKVKKMSGQ